MFRFAKNDRIFIYQRNGDEPPLHIQKIISIGDNDMMYVVCELHSLEAARGRVDYWNAFYTKLQVEYEFVVVIKKLLDKYDALAEQFNVAS